LHLTPTYPCLHCIFVFSIDRLSPNKPLSESTAMERSSGSEYIPSCDEHSDKEERVPPTPKLPKRRKRSAKKMADDEEWRTDDEDWEYSDEEQGRRKKNRKGMKYIDWLF